VYDLRRELLTVDRDREPATGVCNTCGHPLDHLCECSRYSPRKAASAKMLRIKQQHHDLFREIDRIVAKSW